MKHLIILERIWLPLGVMPPPKKLIHLLVIPMLSRSELVLHRFLPGVTPLTGQRRRRPEERMDVPTGFLSPTAYLAPASFLSTHDTSEQSPLCSGAFLCSRTKKRHPPAPFQIATAYAGSRFGLGRRLEVRLRNCLSTSPPPSGCKASPFFPS